ncbi:MAG: GNAT family N-acetyltransferase [Phycisphaerales bacterium]
MPTSTFVPDIASMGDDVARRIERHFDSAFRLLLRGPESVQTEHAATFISGEAHPFGNFASLTRSDDVDAVRASIETLAPVTAPKALLFAGGAVSAPVAEAMREAGYTEVPGLPGMAVEIGAMADAPAPDGYTFARIDRVDQGDAWTVAFADGYELPRPVGAAFGPLALGIDAAPDATVQWFAVMHEGAMVATSMLILLDGLAGIYGVATLPAERKKGLGAFATAQALLRAKDLGYRVGILQASEMGKPVYARLGFREFGGIGLWVKMPAG